ncbi:MAG: hypothetical protein GWP91_00510 [Rhodobacterales bacterium]|nr:hypothetical protein [Rhodobacterales bacterium]
MKRAGRARRELLIHMTPQAEIIVDVGADHGHVAAAVGAIAVERLPNRAGRTDVPWVICDGLSAFSRVDVAIIAGMGAKTIAGILSRGPTPSVAVLHAPDDPGLLRRWLADHGWVIEAEGLAPEAGRYAEVIRARRGTESSSGLTLEFGPRLLSDGDPLLHAHLTHLHGYWTQLAQQTKGRAPEKHQQQRARADFLGQCLAEIPYPHGT